MLKKNKTVRVILLLIITNLLTFILSGFMMIKAGDKVVLSKSDFDRLMETYEKYQKVEYVQKLIEKEYYKEVEDETFLKGQLKGLVASLEDPYSVYLTQDEYKELTEETSGVFGGIGVIVSPGEDNFITVVSPIEGTPGAKAGIKSGDKILKVDGEEFTADKMNDAVKVMKGKPGTEVTLTIMRKNKDNKNEFLDLKIKREQIRVETVEHQMLEDNIGYIRLKSFDELSHKDFKKALKDIESKNAKGLIVDLRSNPGGLLDVCADITDEFLGEVNIVYTQDKYGNKEYLNSKKNKTDIPLVVLVNEGSASASEIFTGAMKDHKRAKIVGHTTFGKGLVQNIRRLPDGSGLKLTISEYFTPNGTNIHGVGIEPDYVIDLPEDIEGIGVEFIEKDTQLQKAIELLK